MPANRQKRRCAVPGCRAWARRGGAYCAAHERRAGQAPPELAPLFRSPGPLPRDLELIDQELRDLLAARAYFQAWSEEVRRAESGEAGMSPAQFLRAWNDSTSRILQLLRARRELSGAGTDALDELIERVYAQLEGGDTGPQGGER